MKIWNGHHPRPQACSTGEDLQGILAEATDLVLQAKSSEGIEGVIPDLKRVLQVRRLEGILTEATDLVLQAKSSKSSEGIIPDLKLVLRVKISRASSPRPPTLFCRPRAPRASSPTSSVFSRSGGSRASSPRPPTLFCRPRAPRAPRASSPTRVFYR